MQMSKTSITLKDVILGEKMDESTRIKLFDLYKEDIKNGVAKENCQARTVLILGNERIIGSAILTYIEGCNYVDTSSELYGAGFDGLIYAIDNFNVEKNVKFSTFAMMCIKHHLFKYLNKKNKEIETVSLSTLAKNKYDEDMEYDVPDPYDFVEDVITSLDSRIKLRNVLSKFIYLTEQEQDIIIHHFGICNFKKTPYYIRSTQLGCARSTGYNDYSKALTKLKLLFCPETVSVEDQQKKQKILRKTYPLLPEIESYIHKDIEDYYAPAL